MVFLDFIINVSIFALLVIIPFVISSLTQPKALKNYRLLVGLYGGIVSFILVLISIQQQGYSYDIRYAPVILVYTYFGPVAGIITGVFALVARLIVGGNWYPVLTGWAMIMVGFTVVHFYVKQLSIVKKNLIFYGVYVCLYLITVILFGIFIDSPVFHIEYLVFIALGVIVGGLLIESYTKLNRVNEELSDIYERVEESEARYRLIAENTSDLIKVMDKGHVVSYFSPSHKTVLGYEIDEIRRMELCEIIHPEDAHLFKNSVEKMYKTKQSYSIEFRFRHKSGHWIDLESRCVPVQGDDGEIENIVFISRDISERKKADELLLQSEKLSIVGELAAGVAHEIRNPLTTIKGFVQLNKWENGLDSYNDILLSELNRIEGITSELLSLGKPQAVQQLETDLRKLIENTVGILSPQAILNNIAFKVEVEEGTSFVILSEQDQMKQVFLNVFKNAMESMDQGGAIKVNLRKNGETECLITVEDQGCGISEDVLQRLGEPFYTLKEKGTGLGIMISHKIIKQHRGNITYKSKVNEGTLVKIKLPLIIANNAQMD